VNQNLTEKDIICRDFQIGKFNTKKIIPTVTMKIDINIEKMLIKRNEINTTSSYHVTIYQYLLKAISETITKYPLLYSIFYKGKIIKYSSLDINVPVSINNHVEYIVLRNINTKSLEEIVREMDEGLTDIKSDSNLLMRSLQEMDKLNKLQKVIYKIKNFKNPVYFINKYYGQFPVTNFGTFNINSGTMVLSEPIIAGLAVGKAEKKLIVKDKITVEETILPLTISFDHRVMDGSYAGNFLNELKKYIENLI